MKALSLNAPHLMVIVGIPGAGKTTFGRYFSDTFNAPYICSEDYDSISGANLPKKMKQAICTKLLTELLRTKQSVLYDCGGETHAQRLDLMRLAKKAGYQTLFIWVQTETATARQRTSKSSSPRMSSEEFDHNVTKFSALNTNEPTVVVSGKHTQATQLKAVLKRLANRPDNEPARQIPERAQQTKRPTSSTRKNITIR